MPPKTLHTSLLRWGAVALAFLMLSLPACNRGAEGPAEDREAASTPSESNPERTASQASGRPSPAAPESPRVGGELRLSVSGITTLDPAASTGVNEGLVINQVFQGLVRLDWHLRVVPDLATSWSISDDGRVYTFELDSKARWHDGPRVVADDVRYSIARLLDPARDSIVRPYLTDLLDGGANAVTTEGDSIVRIRVREPDHVFIKILAMQHLKVVPRAHADSESFESEPIGSGPFQFATRRPKGITLTAARREGEARPYLDRILVLDLSPEAEQKAAEEGNLDYFVVSSTSSMNFDSAEEYVVDQITPLSVQMLAINVEHGPFRDVRVRKAVAAALDPASLERTMRGDVVAASSIIPPGLPGHDPDRSRLYPYDLERAHDLMASAGFGPDTEPFPEVSILLGRIPHEIAIREFLNKSLSRIGIRVRFESPRTYEEYLRKIDEVALVFVGWGADYPDPDSFLHNLFPTDAPHNVTQYASPELDAMIDRARHGAARTVDRVVAYEDVLREIADRCIAIPLFYDATRHYIKSNLRGLLPNPMGVYSTRFDNVWIAADTP